MGDVEVEEQSVTRRVGRAREVMLRSEAEVRWAGSGMARERREECIFKEG